MGVEHAPRLAGGAGGVAEPGGLALVAVDPVGFLGGFREPVFEADEAG